MKVKDYMIGDILMAHLDDGENIKDFPVVINGLDELGTLVDGDCEFSWSPLNKEDDDIQYADALFPIPLTPEILEKNSFKYDGGEIWDIRWDDEDGHHCMNFRKMYRKSDGVWDSLGIMMGGEVTLIKYVHELQHALKLCGLEELASNFKI